MKKIGVIGIIAALVLMFLPVNTLAATGDETVATQSIAHVHETPGQADNYTTNSSCHTTAYTATIHTHTTSCYHYHSGSESTSPNGCYTNAYSKKTHTHTYSGTLYNNCTFSTAADLNSCGGGTHYFAPYRSGTLATQSGGCYTGTAYCGHTYGDGWHIHTGTWGAGYYTEYQPFISGSLGCGDDCNCVVGYYLTCNIPEYTTYYSLGCGKSNGQLICTQPTTATRYKCTLGTSSIGSINMIKNRTSGYTLRIEGTNKVTVTGYAWSTPNGSSSSSSVNVTGNGSYSCTVSYKDAYSGVAGTKTLTYTVSDYISITSLTQNPTEWTAENVSITCDAINAASYSLDNATWQSSNVLAVSENGTYTVYAKDNSGTVVNKSITITNIDKSVPAVSISATGYTEGEWTNQNVMLIASDSETHPSGITYQWYKDSVKLNGAGLYCYNASETGTYSCEIKTGAGLTDTATFEVKIDKTVPDLTMTANVDSGKWTNQDVTMTCNNSVTSPSGVSYEWYKGVTLLPNTTSQLIVFEESEAEDYSCKVTTGSGNSSTVHFTVCIDKTVPELSAIYSDEWTKTTVEVTLSDNDTHHNKFYCNGTEISTPYIITVNGTYSFTSDDLAGNISEPKVVEVTWIDKTAPVGSINVTNEKKSFITVDVSVTDEALDYYEKYLDAELLSTEYFTENTVTIPEKLNINGTYKWVVYDKAGNSTALTKTVSGLVFAYDLDETAEVSHQHKGSEKTKGYCYTEKHETTKPGQKWVVDSNGIAHCPIGSYCNGNGWIVTAANYGLDEHPYENGHWEDDPKKITTYLRNCGLSSGEVIGTVTLRKDASGSEYLLYLEDDLSDHIEIVSYLWTGTSTTLSTNGKAEDVTGVTEDTIVIPDFGYYECEVVLKDTITQKTTKLTFYHEIEDFDLEPPTVSYKVISQDKSSNVIKFDFADNMVLKELTVGDSTYPLTGKEDSLTLTFSKEYHDLTVKDAMGNAYDFKVNDNYLKDLTDYSKTGAYTDIYISAYPFNYEDGKNPSGTIAGYAISNVLESIPSDLSLLTYSSYQSDGKFKELYKNGKYAIAIKDTLGNTMYYVTEINSLSGLLDVRIVDMSDKGIKLGETVKPGAIGQTFAGSILGADATLSKYYEGYNYTTCTTTVVTPLIDNIVYRYFKIKVFNIEYYDDDGDSFANEKVEYGNRNTITIVPKKNSRIEDSFTIDYYFDHWADANGNIVDLSSIKNDMVLYPVFFEVRNDSIHTVRFYFDYEADKNWYEEYEVPHKSGVTPPSVPDKETKVLSDTESIEYTFKNWGTADGNVAYDFSCIEYDTDFFAQYDEEHKVVVPEIKDTTEVLEKEASFIEVEPVTFVKPSVNIEETKTPTNPLKAFYEENADTVKTVAKTAGFSALTLGLLEILSFIFTGFSVLQLIIFLTALKKRKRRYIQGAWCVGYPDMQYVDKYGHTLSIIDGLYTYKDNTYTAVDVEYEIERLNSGRISYKEFQSIVKASEVYTVFNEDVEVECSNIKNTYSSKVHGFNIVNTIKHLITSAGNYKVKIKNGSKEMMYHMSVAINGSRI